MPLRGSCRPGRASSTASRPLPRRAAPRPPVPPSQRPCSGPCSRRWTPTAHCSPPPPPLPYVPCAPHPRHANPVSSAICDGRAILQHKRIVVLEQRVALAYMPEAPETWLPSVLDCLVRALPLPPTRVAAPPHHREVVVHVGRTKASGWCKLAGRRWKPTLRSSLPGALPSAVIGTMHHASLTHAEGAWSSLSDRCVQRLQCGVSAVWPKALCGCRRCPGADLPAHRQAPRPVSRTS